MIKTYAEFMVTQWSYNKTEVKEVKGFGITNNTHQTYDKHVWFNGLTNEKLKTYLSLAQKISNFRYDMRYSNDQKTLIDGIEKMGIELAENMLDKWTKAWDNDYKWITDFYQTYPMLGLDGAIVTENNVSLISDYINNIDELNNKRT